ncbi:nitrite reductase/ring-hydroxylating ferredoxin subunit [Leucobacter exalbidus]|uniref:Rieske-type oxygenase n=1 Tax=Leucobacter exalbidus TaxID=662960 RepID=A0A940T5G7_9MICO|nr:Rieske 2Fe-2S domain-containing protein [Leucobacter exalbidus]MBP1325981.1 nitrite reductase/ring-hydroxylating ferredoxin subunit [Leucobacter exalbidus]
MQPTGWFQIGWSSDLENGAVKPLNVFSRDLVLFRTESGKLVVLNAYCEHLGANMAYGGKVCGEDIQCPFHAWKWNAAGRNTEIPYQATVNRVRRIGTWHVAERDGLMYLWHNVDGGKPHYEVPSVFELFKDSGGPEQYHDPATTGGRFEAEPLPIHPQYAAENGVDFAHFKYVHRADEIPTVLSREFGEYTFQSELALEFKRRKADGELESVDGRTNAYLLGLGLGFSYAYGAGGICSITSVTPIDDENSILRFTAWASIEEGEDDVRVAKRQRSAIGQLRADLDIWKYQRYTEPPGLATAEAAGFRDIRQWARRFYAEGHHGSGAAEQTAGTDELLEQGA